MSIQALRSYRATIIPAGVNADEVEFHAEQGLLPSVRLKSTDAGRAAAAAHTVTGRPVFKIERIEVAA